MEQNREFRDRFTHKWSIDFDKGTKAIQWKKYSSSINGAGIINVHMQNMICDP